MQFLFPWFLLAGLSIAIPVIIHLFYFRRFKKVMFSNVRFLKEIKEETTSRSRIKNLLVLAMRCLALLALVLAFAQPFWRKDKDARNGEKAVSVFVDNSFSMNSLSKEVPLLEAAKKRAREIVQAYGPEDRFQILTQDFEGRHQRLISKDDALSMIDEIKISPSVHTVDKIISRQSQVLSSSGSPIKTAYYISDFQKNSSNFLSLKDSTTEITLVPLRSVEEKNISIDSAWFESPVQTLNQNARLLVKLTNHGKEDASEIRITLKQAEQIKPVGTASIKAGSSKVDTITVSVTKPGLQNAEVQITDYPVTFDDNYFFTFNVEQTVPVLVVNENGTNNFLDAALGSGNYFKVTNTSIGNIEYSKLKDFRLIVLNGISTISTGLAAELNTFSKDGGNVLLFPGRNANLSSLQSLFSTIPSPGLGAWETIDKPVSEINLKEWVFRDVYETKKVNLRLPVTKGNFRIPRSDGHENLLTYRDGSCFMAKYKNQLGHYYICASPLDIEFNDLVKNSEVFVPMIYRMAISKSGDRKIAYTIGKDEVIETPHFAGGNQETAYKIQGKKGEFIPGQRVLGNKVSFSLNHQISESGIYKLISKGDSIKNEIAFNYDRLESNMEFYRGEDLQKIIPKNVQILDATSEANLSQLVGEKETGIIFWRWLVIIALLALAMEIFFLRYWK
jgi:hypothetical protein